MYKGITFQGFLQPLSKKDPCHLTSISLTKKWENQRHTKESKKQLSKSPCPCTIEKNMIKDFFFKMKEKKKNMYLPNKTPSFGHDPKLKGFPPIRLL